MSSETESKERSAGSSAPSSSTTTPTGTAGPSTSSGPGYSLWMHPQGNTAHFLLTGDRYLCGMPKPNTHVQLPESAIPGVSPCSRCYAAKSRREITKVATATPPKKSTLEGLLETMAEHNAKLASRKINWKQYRKRAVETERAILAERQRIASSLTPEATA